jgi:protoporphyrinogen/coproporphyrinogen III oxidase
MPSRGHAVVIGGGVAGLVWALDAVEAGYHVTVHERSDRFGGAVRREPLGPVAVDVGAESFALTRPDVLELAERLDLSDQVERPATHQAHVLTGERLLPLPPGLLGIPADPTDIARLLGPEVAEEAVRRDRAPVTAYAPATLGRLARDRLGDTVVDLLVDPVIAGVHATRADDAELASVAPSLAGATVRHGGLMAGVRALRGPLGPAGAPVATLAGGMGRLVDRLTEQLTLRGATLRLNSAVTALHHEGTWRVRTAAGEITADVVCLALPARPAADLLAATAGTAGILATHLGDLPITDDVVLVTLLVEDAALTLAGEPVGSGVLIARPGLDPAADDDRVEAHGPLRAKALTHASVKWDWLTTRLPANYHVVRLSFGGTNVLPEGAETGVVEAARAELARLLDAAGAPLGDGATVRASLVTRWSGALSRPVVGRRASLDAIDAALAELPGLALVGSAVAGNGLAGVVGRSRTEATRTL